jgi:hypothetical protein
LSNYFGAIEICRVCIQRKAGFRLSKPRYYHSPHSLRSRTAYLPRTSIPPM